VIHVQNISAGLLIHHNYLNRPATFVPTSGANLEAIDLAAAVVGAKIYNNVIVGSYIDVKNGSTGALVYGNSIYLPSNDTDHSCFFAMADSTGAQFKNNICQMMMSGTYYAVYLEPGA